MLEEQKRAAERIALKEPIEAQLAGADARIVEISLIGCRAEHFDRLPLHGTARLAFRSHGIEVDIRVKVARTEMRSRDGRTMYISGLQFADSVDQAPEAIKQILVAVLEPEARDQQDPVVQHILEAAPFLRYDEDVEEEEIDIASEETLYVECVFDQGRWTTTRVSDPKQPREGFVMVAPEDEAEIDQYCRSYEYADPSTRNLIRLSLELGIAQRKRQ